MPKSVNSDPIKLKNVRLSFPSLREPTKFDESNEKEIPKFKASFILDPSDAGHQATIKEIETAAKKIIKEMWGGKPPKMKDIECFGEGNNKISESTGEVYDGYQDMFFVSGNNPKRPICMYRDKTPIEKADVEDVLYAGCYVNASINLWTQDNQYGKAIRCQVRGVQFFRDGEPFGGGAVDTDAEFDDFGDAENEGVEMDFEL